MKNIELIKILSPFLKRYSLQIAIALFLLPLSSFTYSVQPLILQKAIDGPLSSGKLDALGFYVLALAVAVIANFLLQIYQFLLMNKVGQNVVANIRFELFSHLEKLSMRFFDRTPVGRSVSRITSDMEQLAESFVGGLVLILLDIFNVVGILGFMFYLNWKLSLAVSVFLIPIYFITNYYQEVYRKANLDARKELSALNSFLQQNIVGISVVQLLNSAQKSMSKFAENNLAYFKANDESIRADAQLSAAIETISIIAIASLIYISMLIILSKNISLSGLTIGIILAFIQYAQSLFEPIRNLSDRFTIVQSAFTAIERMKQLLDEPIEIKDGVIDLRESNAAMWDSTASIIEFRDVWFKYDIHEDSDWILKGLSFSLKPGQKLAIIGRTGSGKSTIIKLLTRLYEPQRGEILIAGVNIRDLKQSALRELIAVVHQDSYIFAGDLDANIHLNRDSSLLKMDLAKSFLKLAPKLDSKISLSERGANISAGEEQIINFARAVVTDPPILVLDEATSSIDLATEKQIQESLQKFLQNKTAIIIAHRLETTKFCDLVLEIKEGKSN